MLAELQMALAEALEPDFVQAKVSGTPMSLLCLPKASTSVSEQEIGEAEENNYEILEASTAKKFRDRLDLFFENTSQEDLLAFAEEAVLESEEDPDSLVSKEGREPIFIALKTIVDVLTTED